MPLVAQVTAAVALTALIVGPWWASTPDAIEASFATEPVPVTVTIPTPSIPIDVAPVPPRPAPVTVGPAHLNLDVRHTFGSVDFSVTVDGKTAFQAKLDGSGKRFGVFGKRSERGYTKTLDLSPGVHLVRVRVSSPNDKFDQSRVERFDLGASSVASMRISADKSGLSLVAERPSAPVPSTPAPGPPAVAPVTASAIPAPAPVQLSNPGVAQPSPAASRQDVNAVADLLQSVRSMLIAIAGFVASAATGFVVQEYLRSRRSLLFAGGPDGSRPARREPQKRRRPLKSRPRHNVEDDNDDEGFESEADRERTTA